MPLFRWGLLGLFLCLWLNGVAEPVVSPASLQQQAQGGDSEAMYQLGLRYERGIETSVDHHQAILWYQRAIEQEHPEAGYRLGQLLFHGTGIEADEQRAFQLTQVAAKKNLAEAQYFLGWMYEQGRGVNKDLPNAIRWYRAAKLQGHKKAGKALQRIVRSLKQRK